MPTNNLGSNFSTKLLGLGFIKPCETSRVHSKNVDTQFLKGKFDPRAGSTIDIKKPHDGKTIRTSDGDISLSTKSDIVAGKAQATVQNYFTSAVEYGEFDEARKLNELQKILEPYAQRIVTDMEVDFGQYMHDNANGYVGTVGTAADAWSDIAAADAYLKSLGVKMDAPWYAAINPYTCAELADVQRSLGSGGTSGSLVKTAWEKALISDNVGGLTVMTSNTLGTVATQSGADRAGTLSSNPSVDYVTHKDTYVQTLPVTGFQANLEVKKGERLTIAGRYRLNQSTRTPFFDSAGAKILFSAVVAADVTLGASGDGNITIVGPAIYESTGAYNTVDSAPVSGDVVTLLGSAATTYQPNLFWHKNAFGLAFCDMRKLYATDSMFKTKDGLRMRVSRYSDGDANTQKVRFDILPAYATYNPYWAGHLWGS